ncbi:hypothetical protein [Scytonema sp. NUACC26]|uniref:hypothetical protein n=1 Tax=Scytonema sp. NUACC26 TaxID=3140176 RepID=UPI0038B32B4E
MSKAESFEFQPDTTEIPDGKYSIPAGLNRNSGWKMLNSSRTQQKFWMENAQFQPDTIEILDGKCLIPAGLSINSCDLNHNLVLVRFW